MQWLSSIKRKHPLIECLTNDVTVTDVANVILAAGAAPVMGIAQEEIADWVRMASAIVINIGTLNETMRPTYESAFQTAAANGKPVVFDPVGVGATPYRTAFATDMLRRHGATVIRGNASEIAALAGQACRTNGVDASPDDVITEATLTLHRRNAETVARAFHCVVAMSGALDIITDGEHSCLCANGVPWMSRVTGTGCSLTGLTAAFIAVSSGALEANLEAAAMGTAMMGCAGELAYQKTQHLGLGSFHVALHDSLSQITDRELAAMAKLTNL